MLKPQQGQNGKECEIQQTNSSSPAPGGQAPLQEQPQLQLTALTSCSPRRKSVGESTVPISSYENREKPESAHQQTGNWLQNV